MTHRVAKALLLPHDSDLQQNNNKLEKDRKKFRRGNYEGRRNATR